jgi:aminoglycoside 3-N-acetyltransferase
VFNPDRHSSLSSIGWVCGGAGAVIQALEASLGKDGTLVMPAFSGGMTEPSHWQSPPVPDTWWETIRTSTPLYDPDPLHGARLPKPSGHVQA